MDVKLYGTSSAGRDYSIYRTAPSAPDPVRRPPVGSTGTYDQLTLHKTQYPADTRQFARQPCGRGDLYSRCPSDGPAYAFLLIDMR